MSEAASPRRSGWIPYAFIGAMLFVVAVNGGLVYAALSTFTGVTVGQAYDRGRAYNDVIAEAERQEALGWTPELVLSAETLRVNVRDRAGVPVTGRLEGFLLRPIEGSTLPLELTPVMAGQWAALVSPKPGQWEARLRLTTADGRRLDIRQRLLAP
jgi:nitrogen fixation protein FixH